MKTFAQLKTEVRNLIWPNSEAENLISAHNAMVEACLAECQKWIPCERDSNVNIYPACSTWFRCGLTVFDKPDGIILRLYTIANGEWCDPVFYRQKEWPEPEKLARNLISYTQPLNVGFPRLPQGFKFAESSTDLDSRCGRARAGIWSIWNKKIYVYPWIQSNESIVVEWKGIKKVWLDTDLVNEDIDFRECVKLFVQYAHERDFGSPVESDRYRKLYADKFSELIHECRERTAKRSDIDYDDTRSRLTAEIDDDAAPDPAETVFGHVGNYGVDSVTEEQVGQLARSWLPSFLIAGAQHSSDGSYDADVGQYFHDFIFPYQGSYGDGAATNMFWPAVGKTDWDVAPNDLATWKAFFKLPNNERYYELVRGDVHFFFIDSDSREPDAITSGGTQGAWLQAKLALSTSAWKVVVMSKPPFSSGATTGSTGTLQWPFATWGADMVVASEAGLYERLTKNSIPYLVNGLGGGAIEAFGALDSDSQFQYNEDNGAIKFTASATSLKAEFWNRFGYLIDSVELTQ